MSSRSKRVFFGAFVFVVDENVYEPAEDTFLLAENLDVNDGDIILDMGTGCGILGILAAKRAKYVVAVDINPYAVRCAKENALLNNARSKISFIQADLFEAFSEKTKFDMILFNAPYLPVEENESTSWVSQAWSGGATGREVIDRFITESVAHLKERGRIILLQSSLADIEGTLLALKKQCMSGKVTAECVQPFFEKIVLLEGKKH
ncbi:MAG TPA: HemK2/MTQ2 family protein methyltransferase [Candidatus Bathyarchaeia archaeon]|nr:HemK2/MTQ2 family protein methyltransferase [Candidatus Bathyarchaeia archaeon]